MKYKIFEDRVEKLPTFLKDVVSGKDYFMPTLDFTILEEEYKELNSLARLSGEYIREIVQKMEEVRDGKLEDYRFGPQDSIIVYVFGKNTPHQKYAAKTYYRMSFTKEMNEIPFEEVYGLMKDYLIEIEKWEKRTGMKKPGR